MRAAAIRQAMARPARKAPSLLKFPFYDLAADLFRRECPEVQLVGLELERGIFGGQEIWIASSYAGVRSSKGISVHHHLPMTNLAWDDIETVVLSLARTTCQAWERREQQRRARERFGGQIQQPVR